MDRPPQKLPMGKPIQDKPKPAPQPMRQPSSPQGAGPSGPRGHVPTKKSSGTSIIVTLLIIFGSFGLLVVLLCAGVIGYFWHIGNQVQQEIARQNAQQQNAQRQNDNRPDFGGPVFRPSNDRSNAQPKPIDSVASAIDALRSNDHFRRQKGVKYLTEETVEAAHREQVISAVLPLFSDGSRREDAARILEHWSTIDSANRQALQQIQAEFAPHLLPFLNDRDHRQRETARQLLAKWEVDDITLAQQCLRDLSSAEEERIREAARWLKAHVIIDEVLSPQISAALIALISNRNVRQDVVSALNLWASAESVPALIEAAGEAHAAQDRDAQRACIQLLTPLADARALSAYADYLGARHDRTVARAAFATFGEGGAKTLLPYIHHEDGNIRQIARELLTEWEVEASHWQAQSLADLQSGDEKRQRESIRYLLSVEPGQSPNPNIALALIELVDQQRLRHDALRALKVWAGPEVVPKLIELLAHEDRGVQGQVRSILVATKDPRAVAPIAAGFGKDFLPRVEARRNLVAMGPVAESALWPHVTDDNWQVAKDACETLGEIGTKKSLPSLQLALSHQSSHVKRAAQTAIQRVTEADRQVGPMPHVAVVDPLQPRPSGGAAPVMRTWTDASGTSTVDAVFVEFALGRVRLRTRENRFLSLKLSQLSPADREYVQQQVQP